MSEVQGERLAAERELGRSVPAEPLTKAQLRKILKGVLDGVRMLATADRDLKARLYTELGVRLEYRPDEREVTVEVTLDRCATGRARGGTRTPTPPKGTAAFKATADASFATRARVKSVAADQAG